MPAVDRYAEICAAHRWDVPSDFNLAEACCGRWAADRTRFALYWEDEDGTRAALTFWDLQQQANRLSNALTSAGIRRGDRIALILPQRPETIVAHLACHQVGAVAVPLSFLFGPEALEYRLQNSAAKIAFVDPQSLPNLQPIRDRCGTLRHVVGVAGATGPGIDSWESLQPAPRQFPRVATRATDAALLIYTSGTTGPPKGALMPQQCLLGNLPGFIHSHDGFPQPGDLFWSPADWAWTGGLMDALLPTLYFGQPIVGYRGRFDAERALRLIERYQIRNTFLFPTALKLMMKAFPKPRDAFDINLRSIMSAGEAVGTTVFEWARDRIGPSEIENCLVKHPAVANAAVVPSPDETRGNVVKAFIVLAPGHAASPELEADIAQHVRKHLAPYEYPKEIEFIDALPMTTTGKVQRKVLRDREAARKRALP